MSLDKIAEILHVDEVRVMHGPRGVAVHVRIEKSWRSSTIDNEDLGERRLEAIAEHLAHLADANVYRLRDNLRKSRAAMADVATRYPAVASMLDGRTRMPTWGDVPFDRPYDGVVRQVQRPVLEPVARLSPPPEPPEPAASEPMPSRFHAIVAELRGL